MGQEGFLSDEDEDEEPNIIKTKQIWITKFKP
jgi:hypothetical protein